MSLAERVEDSIATSRRNRAAGIAPPSNVVVHPDTDHGPMNRLIRHVQALRAARQTFPGFYPQQVERDQAAAAAVASNDTSSPDSSDREVRQRQQAQAAYVAGITAPNEQAFREAHAALASSLNGRLEDYYDNLDTDAGAEDERSEDADVEIAVTGQPATGLTRARLMDRLDQYAAAAAQNGWNVQDDRRPGANATSALGDTRPVFSIVTECPGCDRNFGQCQCEEEYYDDDEEDDMDEEEE